MRLSPLLLVDDTIVDICIFVSLLFNSEDCLFVTKDYVVIVGTMVIFGALLVVLFVDQACPGYLQRVVTEHLVFDLF